MLFLLRFIRLIAILGAGAEGGRGVALFFTIGEVVTLLIWSNISLSSTCTDRMYVSSSFIIVLLRDTRSEEEERGGELDRKWKRGRSQETKRNDSLTL